MKSWTSFPPFQLFFIIVVSDEMRPQQKNNWSWSPVGDDE